MFMEIITYKNYLAMIKGSADSKMFRHSYAKDNGLVRDILENGEKSCAYYVSSLLKVFDLIAHQHATVEGTAKDLQKNGWREAKELKPGSVLYWEEKYFFKSKKRHAHLGFFTGQNKAVSNDEATGLIKKHHFTFGVDKKGNPKRRILKIFTHPLIEKRS